MTEKYGTIAVLSPLVTRILGLNPGKFTLEGTNTYLIGAGRKRVLLDTGDGEIEYKHLLERYVKTIGVEIQTVLISHWHYDHLGGASNVADLFPNAKVFKGELPVSVSTDLQMNTIRDGDKFEVETGDDNESAALTAYFTPGHAKDHFVFWLNKENALFSADNVLGTGTSVFEDLAEYMTSLRRMLAIGEAQGVLSKDAQNNPSGSDKPIGGSSGPSGSSGPNIASSFVSVNSQGSHATQDSQKSESPPFRIYPGHGPLISDGASKIKEYITHRQDRENEILTLLKESTSKLTAKQITLHLYRGYPDKILRAAERGILLHLKKLVSESRVEQVEESYSSKL